MENDVYIDYSDIFGHFDDEIFDKYCLSFNDIGFDYSNILEFVCDFELEEMEFYGELFKTLLFNMRNLTDARKQVLINMGFDDWEEFESDIKYPETTNLFFEQLLKDILKIEDEDIQDHTIYQIFDEMIYDTADIRKLQKELFGY